MDERTTWGYARLSVSVASNTEGLPAQEAAIRRHAAEQGWNLEKVFSETARATRGTHRPLFRDLLELVGDQPSTHRIICVNIDRLLRNHEDLEDLTNLVKCGLDVWSLEGEIRLQTQQDVFISEVLVSVKKHEVEELRRRAKFAKEAAKEAGKYLGNSRRTFGYTTKTADRQIEEAEASVLREMFQRVVSGESWSSLAQDLNRRGISTPNGSTWSRQNLAKALETPFIYGELRYKQPDGTYLYKEAPWEPIFDGSHRQALKEVHRNRTKYRGDKSLKHPLSGYLVCGICQEPMVSRTARKYVCTGEGCYNGIAAPETNQLIEKLCLLHLRDHLTPAPAEEPDTADIDRKIKGLQAAYDAQIITRNSYRADMREYEYQRNRLIQAAVQAAPQLPEWMNSEASILSEWQNLSAWDKRELYKRVVGEVIILPWLEGFGQFDPERIRTRFSPTG